MEITRRAVVPGPLSAVFELVDDLGRYPTWMDLVHDVSATDVDDADGRAAWDVELQARVGPFARSKRLRMVRTVHEPPARVVFARVEVDGRQHAPWVLSADLDDVGDGTVEVMMTLTYGGSLWTGAVLQRVLDDHVERGAAALVELRTAS
ncbi:MAG: SRPBCC family protein [Ilumatobacteraceae bacterium]